MESARSCQLVTTLVEAPVGTASFWCHKGRNGPGCFRQFCKQPTKIPSPQNKMNLEQLLWGGPVYSNHSTATLGFPWGGLAATITQIRESIGLISLKSGLRDICQDQARHLPPAARCFGRQSSVGADRSRKTENVGRRLVLKSLKDTVRTGYRQNEPGLPSFRLVKITC